MMKALFLGHAHTNGCRSAYYFPHLARLGIAARYVELPSGAGRLAAIEALTAADAAVVQRSALSSAEMAALRRAAPRVIYDVDDPVMYRSSRHLIQRSLARRRNFRRMVESVDAVIAGTPAIAREAARYVADDRIVTIPSTVDGDLYLPLRRDPAPEGAVTVGWLGSAGTVGYLARLRAVYHETWRRLPEVRFKVVSNRFPDFDGIPIEQKPWRQEDEVADLQSFDIALLPLTDDLWTRGKGHGKLFQYMAVGAAIVGSPVGIVGEFLSDGRTGLLARNRKEWIRAIGRLVGDADLRQSLGTAARRDFEERFSLRATLPALAGLLRGAPRATSP